MAKKTYIGVDEVAKEAKKIYVGVEGIARKVKKIYVGVGNVAKLVYEAVAKVFLGEPYVEYGRICWDAPTGTFPISVSSNFSEGKNIAKKQGSVMYLEPYANDYGYSSGKITAQLTSGEEVYSNTITINNVDITQENRANVGYVSGQSQVVTIPEPTYDETNDEWKVYHALYNSAFLDTSSTDYYLDVILPPCFKYIGMTAFNGRTGNSSALTNLPSAIETLAMGAFYNSKYTINYIPLQCNTITSRCFHNNTYPSTVTYDRQFFIHKNVTSIGTRAFEGTDIVTVIFEGTPNTIGTSAFNTTTITNIFVPWAEGTVSGAPWGATNATITYNCYTAFTTLGKATIEGYPFLADTSYKDKIVELIIPGINTSSASAEVRSKWDSMSELRLLYLAEGMQRIRIAQAFYNNPLLSFVHLPSTLIAITGAQVFANCTNLEEITFRSTLTSMYNNTFYGCTNLKYIRVPWAEGAVANAPWGATNANIIYNYTATDDNF